MLGSKSNYFVESFLVINAKRRLLFEVLKDFRVQDAERFLKSFDYFAHFPYDYDGATLVKDIHTINGYDAPAGNHDYAYLNIDFWSWKGLVQKIKADYQYIKDMESLKISSQTAWLRGVLLMVSTPLYYLLLIFKKH